MPASHRLKAASFENYCLKTVDSGRLSYFIATSNCRFSECGTLILLMRACLVVLWRVTAHGKPIWLQDLDTSCCRGL